MECLRDYNQTDVASCSLSIWSAGALMGKGNKLPRGTDCFLTALYRSRGPVVLSLVCSYFSPSLLEYGNLV